MYPLMVYRGGVKLDEYRIVSSDLEFGEAEKEGFARLDMAAVKGGSVEPVEAAENEPARRRPGRPRKEAA